MAFADPQVVVYPTGTNNSLPNVERAGRSSRYALSNEAVVQTIQHSKRPNGTTASMVRIDISKIAADPLVTTVNRKVQASVWVSLNRRVGEFTDAELLDVVKSLTTFLTASTNAASIKLIAGES